MAVSFNGIFLSRELSAICPALHFNQVSLSNVAPDHLLMDKGDEYSTSITLEGVETIIDPPTKIEPLNSNLKNIGNDMWHLNTELNADFNGTIEGGTLADFDTNVNGVVLRRTSNRSNFQQWEDVVVFPLQIEDLGVFNKEYDDLFVESGIIYKYAIQPLSSSNRGPMIQPATTMLDYQYSWLIGEDEKQIMFAYNPVISSFNKVVKESLIETIGSEYPFIPRNAKVGYRQFQFSASITSLMDIENSIMTEENMFLTPGLIPTSDLINNASSYDAFYKNNGIDNNMNYIIEREFRNKLMEFLYDGKPKIFKSDTEGLMLVKLTNITCPPKNELGRVIYDLNCTMTEIGEVNFDNLIDYKIKKGVKVNEL